ncbi:MAG: ketol-acid reductoisomerase, partial [Planctomycetota bacterium]
MPPDVFRSDDPALLAPLDGKTVAILGYGNQGRAHALNLRDSGTTVIIGTAPDRRGAARAREDGYETLHLAEAAARCDLAIIGLPDESHATVLPEDVFPFLRPSATIGFLHGFSLHYGHVTPPASVGVILVAPKGPGTTLRERFLRGEGIPALIAVHRDNRDSNAMDLVRAWGAGIGCAYAGLLETTFAEETETDLFGEQAVLCGGATELVVAGFETLVEAG